MKKEYNRKVVVDYKGQKLEFEGWNGEGLTESIVNTLLEKFDDIRLSKLGLTRKVSNLLKYYRNLKYKQGIICFGCRMEIFKLGQREIEAK